ncbi:unnamed protein product [Symbiodinium sp. CCMP2592]|nr:unnamed protein product [Symbiodinium sp. CCMP2592]
MCYFHLPQKSHGQSRNHGYAFIGFLTPEVAGRFRDAMTGKAGKVDDAWSTVRREDLEEAGPEKRGAVVSVPSARSSKQGSGVVRKEPPPLRIWKWELGNQTLSEHEGFENDPDIYNVIGRISL